MDDGLMGHHIVHANQFRCWCRWIAKQLLLSIHVHYTHPA